jgi:hypothetical protein
MSKQAREIINPFVDIIGACSFESVKNGDSYMEKRVMKFDPSEYMDAGDRTGLLPSMISLSYKKFAKYFEED